MKTTRPPGHGEGIEVAMAQVPPKMLLTLAVETWRVKRKLSRLRDLSGTDEVAGLDMSVGRMAQCFQDIGIECRDYDGQPYDAGLSVRVLDYEESSELEPGSELIVQTVAPGIFVQGTLVRMGEVVVARGVSRRQETDDAEHS